MRQGYKVAVVLMLLILIVGCVESSGETSTASSTVAPQLATETPPSTVEGVYEPVETPVIETSKPTVTIPPSTEPPVVTEEKTLEVSQVDVEPEENQSEELLVKFNDYKDRLEVQEKEIQALEKTGDFGKIQSMVDNRKLLLNEFKDFIITNKDALEAQGIDTDSEIQAVEDGLSFDPGVVFQEAPPDVGDAEAPVLSMPFKREDYLFQEVGIWPFCVHGGDHPEGHGGIDFELDSKAEVLASADGTVALIAENSHGWGTDVVIEHGQMLAVDYTCLLNVQVGEGDQVTRGQVLGNPCPTDEGVYFIHYGVNNFVESKYECPLEYLDSGFTASLNDLFLTAKYPEQSSEPKLCNCDAVGHKQ